MSLRGNDICNIMSRETSQVIIEFRRNKVLMKTFCWGRGMWMGISYLVWNWWSSFGWYAKTWTKEGEEILGPALIWHSLKCYINFFPHLHFRGYLEFQNVPLERHRSHWEQGKNDRREGGGGWRSLRWGVCWGKGSQRWPAGKHLTVAEDLREHWWMGRDTSQGYGGSWRARMFWLSVAA